MPNKGSRVSQRMARLVSLLAPQEGYTLSALEGVRFMRSNRPLGLTAVLYEPSIVIVCQGRKRGFFGDDTYLYDSQNYLVLSVPLPFFTTTEASMQEPLLAVSVRLDMISIADLVLALDGDGRELLPAPCGIGSAPLEGALADAAVRLLEALSSPIEARILGPGIVREICFRVMMSAQGGAIRAALAHQGKFGRIARAMRRIHTDYAKPLAVNDLAREANLSVPAFHAHFRSVTQTSPIQYIKTTRLHQARLHMIRDRMTAAAAAVQVGYESASQFGREFKRFFGRSPVEEARFMNEAFGLAPARELSRFDIVH